MSSQTSHTPVGESLPAGRGASAAVIQCIEDLRHLESQYPEWFLQYDNAMVDVVADRGTIEALLASAPTEFLRGMLYGKLEMPTQIAFLTERSF